MREWLAARGYSQEWLAEQIATVPVVGRTTRQTSVSAWLRGRTVPLWAALAIEAITGIAARSWLTDRVTPLRSGARRTHARYARLGAR